MMYAQSDLKRPTDSVYGIEKKRTPFSSETASEYGRIVHSPAFRRLQGKTQLFPAGESALLRNRLTHSLEVAEIAARIATHINTITRDPKKQIDVGIVSAAGLAHDLGHPPFGHTGEIALNQRMAAFGGFEGNAQTLRIITKLENRLAKSAPLGAIPETVKLNPVGLNFMFRTIASVLKYDRMIPRYNFSAAEEQTQDMQQEKSIQKEEKSIKKGYYESEREIVAVVRANVLKSAASGSLSTIECQIMDLADDIAYSVYDLEDCMITRVATPSDIISCDKAEIKRVADRASLQLGKYGYGNSNLSPVDVQVIFFDIFGQLLQFDEDSYYDTRSSLDLAIYLAGTYRESRDIARNKIFRRRWIEEFIDQAISAIKVDWNDECLPLSTIDIDTRKRLHIECLKAFNYERVIGSQMLRSNAHKGTGVIWALFDALMNDMSERLIHNDFRLHYPLDTMPESPEDVLPVPLEVRKHLTFHVPEETTCRQLRERMRFVCDYIASLTDDEALEMCGRLKSTDWRSVFGLQF